MKKFIVLTILAMASIIGCKKDNGYHPNGYIDFSLDSLQGKLVYEKSIVKDYDNLDELLEDFWSIWNAKNCYCD
ncbi:MAG: hypothetical protein IPN76_11655 [Saprospiraceae bacterium]|nr:hypothetical protein [Saprospiraceae bacterium]